MKQSRCVFLLPALLVPLAAPAVAQSDPTPLFGGPKEISEVWARLQINPRDPYLQYVVMKRAERRGEQDEFASRIEKLRRRGRGRRKRIDLFDMFTGALAVQESLQLEEMRRSGAVEFGRSTVPISALSGPTLRGHPWQEMLAGRQPKTTRLAGCVPHDQYLIEFKSLNKMLNLLEQADVWGMHFLQQAKQVAHSPQTSKRVKHQLAIRTNPLNRLFYDTVVSGVALTGSDLFSQEGSDVALLFTLKQPVVFKAKMDGYLADAAKSRPDAVRREGKILDVPYVHVSTPDRAVHVYSAYPSPDTSRVRRLR